MCNKKPQIYCVSCCTFGKCCNNTRVIYHIGSTLETTASIIGSYQFIEAGFVPSWKMIPYLQESNASLSECISMGLLQKVEVILTRKVCTSKGHNKIPGVYSSPVP